MFVRRRTYGPNYSGKQHKPTRTHPKSASTMPQDMHKLSARTRYQPRIGPVRPKPTRTGPNSIIGSCIRAVRGLINAQLDDNSSNEAARGSSQRLIQRPTRHGDPCSGSSGGPHVPYGTAFRTAFHTVFHAATHGSPYGTAPQRPTRHSYPAAHDGSRRFHGGPHDDSQRTLTAHAAPHGSSHGATQQPHTTQRHATAPHGSPQQDRIGTLSRRAVTRRGRRRHRGRYRRRASIV